jgi:uncharacterized protein YodC (DUF2158 family)
MAENVEDNKPKQEFPNGSIVKVKSGGPDMTVQDFANYGYEGYQYKCVWFEETKSKNGTKSELKSETIAPIVLELSKKKYNSLVAGSSPARPILFIGE